MNDFAGASGRAFVCAAALLVLAGCAAPDGSASRCSMPARVGTLPPQLDEASGLAASRRHAGVLWTHNDSGGQPEVFAVDSTGAVLGRVRVTGATNDDWEDVALGPCAAGECLYIGDIGDNGGERQEVTVYRVPEPDPADTATPPAERIRLRFPGAPTDAEALFVMPDGRLFIVTKGRAGPVVAYQAPLPLPRDTAALLEPVAELTGGEPFGPLRVTGAAATPDGRWVVVRTYVNLRLYRLEDDGLVAAGDPVDLRVLGEPQGEAVDIRADGTVLLASEERGEPGPISRLVCRLEVG